MTTPMMRQYHDAKAACGEALLLFRMGDFYELFFEDAKTAARVLGLTLTSRDKDSANPVAMAGFPHHQLDSYLRKLISAGFRAAVCEQIGDPKQAKGLVKREITRIVSAGTITDDGLLDPKQANFVAAVHSVIPKGKGNQEPMCGLAWAELSTGQFLSGVFPLSKLEDELERIGPAEVLYREDDLHCSPPNDATWSVTMRPAWSYALDSARETLCKHFGVRDLHGFGFQETDAKGKSGGTDAPAIQAAGAVLSYLQETQPNGLDHFFSVRPYQLAGTLQIDLATRRSLELTRTMRSGDRDGSLLSAIDQTVTSGGARLLADWISSPLLHPTPILQRLDAVQEWKENETQRTEIRSVLKQTFDLVRLLSRVATHRAGPRDLQQVGRSLAMIPEIKSFLNPCSSELLHQLNELLDPCEDLREQLESGLDDEVPISASDRGYIRCGFDRQLDDYRQLAQGGVDWILQYEQQQAQETGISNLKVRNNNVFGYYLEVNHSQRDKVPAHYVRKQTLKNAERFITPELKEYEEKVFAAEDESKKRELLLFQQLRDATHAKLRPLQEIADALATLDVLVSLAELAVQRGWTRPNVVDESILEIRDGRHPVLDATLPQGEFVPNDTFASPEHGMVMLITGPNMAGKSTYIRQIALIQLLAQVGSFVPAVSATVGLADRIFARVGASDELSRGHSTFMVEMVETARILNTATSRSLVILDEIGRGTSTYDGLSLAWSIAEHIHEQIGARTFFATHYHELTQLSDMLPRVTNLNVEVKEWDDQVVMLHRIVTGGADKSYGIHVARLAGIPKVVTERAKDILTQLEADHRDEFDRPTIAPPSASVHQDASRPIQLTMFGLSDHPLLDEIRDVDLDQLTPMQALQFLSEAKERLGGEQATVSSKG